MLKDAAKRSDVRFVHIIFFLTTLAVNRCVCSIAVLNADSVGRVLVDDDD